MSTTPRRRTLTVEEAAQALGISRRLAREAVSICQMATVRLGRQLVVPRGALERFLRKQRDTRRGHDVA